MNKETLLEWYRQMVLIRRFEQACSELYQQGKIGGFLHLYIGQEAVVVGSVGARMDQDHVITAYRDHGHGIAVGADTGELMAELLGKATGVSKGRGGSMHLVDVEKNFWGGYGIVGAHLSLAAGLGLSEQYKGSDAAVLCYFGDGATNIGYFHESLNLSGVWKLPVLWICENNEYGMGTAVNRASAVPRIMDKAKGYDIPAKRVDGNNVIEVHEEVGKALKRIRQGKGPQFLEIMTYRYEGHSMGDPLRYRTREELEERKLRDPISFLVSHMQEKGIATEEELDVIDAQVEEEVATAVKFAEESPFPSFDTLYDHIYVED
ncbi:MAG: pyruvate dehydrogenase (acetyl-transferring) E1 component subunit alpha [Anaerolineales bacterium]|nr:pyruvate dehydrogenase (acetyl-transferring) E1 component subunit alpha [Anaerolineales bacterium]MCB8961991.1 pyruvate dehydrogenase (acetyl-transferring) E1 component subunit alpha [Ardenticatenales bacterium]